MLKEWAKVHGGELESCGYSLRYSKHGEGRECLDIDSSEFVGAISCWAGVCEIQFNSAIDGEFVIIASGISVEGGGLIELMREECLIRRPGQLDDSS